MTDKERQSCIITIRTLRRLALNIHGVIDAVDNDNCDRIISMLKTEQMTGHWEWVQYDGNPKIGNYHCTNCHSIGKAFYDYCPMCGAKMAESEDK